MKLCQNDEVLYRLGQSCLSQQGRLERSLDNRLLCWAFITVLAFLFGCFSGNIFFFFDMLCCGYFMSRAGRERIHAEKTEADNSLQKDGIVKTKGAVLKYEEKEKEDGFFQFIGWFIVLFTGLFFIVLIFHREEMGFPIIFSENMARTGAVILLLIKEGAYQIAYRRQNMPGNSVPLGYRYSQLPTISTLLACLLSNLGQEPVIPYVLVTTYFFVMILFCPVFKKNTFL